MGSTHCNSFKYLSLTRNRWVFSNELSASDQSGHSIYTTSSSKKLNGASWSISYGDGSSASGDVYTDTVSVGKATVTNQAVEAAATISAEFVQDQDNDGLLGLAFDSINTGSSRLSPELRARSPCLLMLTFYPTSFSASTKDVHL